MSTITTIEQLHALEPGQWIQDAEGESFCLVDTHIGWAQRMWMRVGGVSFSHIEHPALPAELMVLNEQPGFACPHQRLNECGHCTRCGIVTGSIASEATT